MRESAKFQFPSNKPISLGFATGNRLALGYLESCWLPELCTVIEYYPISRALIIVDENECTRTNDCKDVNTGGLKVGVASCKDTAGNYSCVCSSGFTYDSSARTCTGTSSITVDFVPQHKNYYLTALFKQASLMIFFSKMLTNAVVHQRTTVTSQAAPPVPTHLEVLPVHVNLDFRELELLAPAKVTSWYIWIILAWSYYAKTYLLWVFVFLIRK